MNNRCDVFKLTSDDWYPRHQLTDGTALVRVTFTPLIMASDEPPMWRVCAWGGDDMGLEQDFSCERTAWTCFLFVIGLESVTHQALRNAGFISA